MAEINITWPKKDKGSSYNVLNACSPDVKSCEATFADIVTALGDTTSEVEHTEQYHHEELPPEEDHVGA
jgi:hypothetical protein